MSFLAKTFWQTIVGCLVVLSVGCTSAPIPGIYNMTTQQKMQSVYHWDVLADDVAGQIKVGLTNAGVKGSPVYVHKSKDSPFGEGFHNMLVTRLFNSGVPVVREISAGVVDVDYQTQVVYHRKSKIQPPSAMTWAFLTGAVLVLRDAALHGGWVDNILTVGGVLVAGALLDEATGYYFTRGAPNTEVIITTSATRAEQYLFRKTDCYYLNRGDAYLYEFTAGKTVKVVN